MLKLYKSYLILLSVGITKKLTRQYVGPFQIKERVDRLVDKLNKLCDWRIYLVFLVVQLEPASGLAEDPFRRPWLEQPPSVFVEDDSDKHKFFEIERFSNKCTVKKDKDLAIEYLVC